MALPHNKQKELHEKLDLKFGPSKRTTYIPNEDKVIWDKMYKEEKEARQEAVE